MSFLSSRKSGETRAELLEIQRLTQAMANLDRCLNPRTAKPKREKATA